MPRPKRILYVQHANPAAFPPIEYSSRIFADAGWEVRLLGVHTEGPGALELPEHRSVTSEVMPYTAPGWRQKAAYLRFLQRTLAIARSWKPDWLYVSDPLAAPAGTLVAATLGCKVAYHEHDSPDPGAAGSKFMRLVLAARERLARRAELSILPQADRARLFAAATGTRRPVHCVWNCPPRREAEEPVARLRHEHEPLGIYFHGSINLDRVPLALIEGARRCGIPVRVRLVGYETIGSRGACDRLREAAAGAPNIELEFPGAVSRVRLRALMAGMHAGWINYAERGLDVNMKYMVGASNKAFDYMAAGLPLIVPNRQDWESTYVEPGYARACDPLDPDDIAQTLRWFYANRESGAEMGARGQQRIRTDWNYEARFAPVLGIMQESAEH